MKFLCPSCKAKYQIADEKVAGRSVRMKCRKCGHVIQVSSIAGVGDAILGSVPPPAVDAPSEASAAGVPAAPAQPAVEPKRLGSSPIGPTVPKPAPVVKGPLPAPKPPPPGKSSPMKPAAPPAAQPLALKSNKKTIQGGTSALP